MTSPLSPKPSYADVIIADFRYETSRAAQIQERVLSEILRKNAGTEYLSRFLGDACDLNSDSSDAQSRLIHEFRLRVPTVTHSDLKPLFDRIADGDRSPILTADPVDTLSLSSGTTSDGQQKYLILYKEILDASLKLAKISGAFRSRAFPIRSGKKLLDLVFSGKVTTTKGKIKTGTATTHLFRSKEFKLKYKSTNVKACSPEEVIRASNNRQAMYCHLLSSLVHREDIEFIHSTFAYSIVEAMRTLETEWPRMCHDIRHGALSGLVTDECVRDAMHAEILTRPRPDLAHSIARVCSRLASSDISWAGLVPKLWPNCKYILSIMTGAMEPYLKKLQHYGGHLPLVSSDYGATESWVGVNTNPKAAPQDTTFTVVPTFAYFEFIPQVHANGETSEELVGLTDVQVGQEYEVVMTTYGGLYRYRLGDIVRVTGFYNQSPQLAYVCRKNVVLTVHIDKNTEKDLQIAVNEGMDKLREHDPTIELVDFTSYASLSTDPGHYVIFVELNRLPHKNKLESVVIEENDAHRVNESIALLQECATTIDLAFLDPGYVGSRKIHTIGSLELCLVKPGTFRSLLDRYLTRGAAITQYKTPRCIPSDELRRILHSKVIASTHSTAYL